MKGLNADDRTKLSTILALLDTKAADTPRSAAAG